MFNSNWIVKYASAMKIPANYQVEIQVNLTERSFISNINMVKIMLVLDFA